MSTRQVSQNQELLRARFSVEEPDDPAAGFEHLKIVPRPIAQYGRSPAELQKFAIKPQRGSMTPLVNFLPVKLGLEKCFFPLRIRNLLTRRRVAEGGESTEFFPASFGHEMAERRFVIGKIEEWTRGGPLLAHENKRSERHETKQSRGGAKGRRRDDMIEARAESVIAGLIVIRDAENELLREQLQCCSRLAKTATPALPALEKPAVLEGRGQLINCALIRFVVTLAGPSEHDSDDMVKIIRPDRVAGPFHPVRGKQEPCFVAFVFRDDKSA